MEDFFSRTQLLLGAEGMRRLAASHVILFGTGGVGSHAAEALVRSGLGAITLIDGDTVAASNCNRQIMATRETVGMVKVEAMRERLAAINPQCRVTARNLFYLPDSRGGVWDTPYDYCVDAVDNVTAKLDIITQAQERGIPVISCMGTGNKLDPSRLRLADLSETSVCPLCRVMRRECKSRGITRLRVVFSDEKPRKPVDNREMNGKIVGGAMRPAPGSTAFVPPVAGLLIAGEVIRTLAGAEILD